jgi:ubiquinone/menaquinone biosynthesis C-methylase UbiE
MVEKNKKLVHDFWDEASCGENLYLDGTKTKDYEKQSKIRYALEPYIIEFADFKNSKNKKILEIGVGLGADHESFAKNGANLWGVDLTNRAVTHTKRRFKKLNLKSNLQIADAEALPFKNNAFDKVYSWGVLHHSPNTENAILEVYRVLKESGSAHIMIYHKWSVVGLILWLRYGLVKFYSLKQTYDKFLESPGTKAYSISETKKMFSTFKKVDISTQLTHGDLLNSNVGQRHKGLVLNIAKIIFPRFLIRIFFKKFGLYMLIIARK